MGNELKPCPFCGNEAEMYSKDTKFGIIAYARCVICGAQTKCVSTDCYDFREEFNGSVAERKIFALWNARNGD